MFKEKETHNLNTSLNSESHIINMHDSNRPPERLKSILKNTRRDSDEDTRLEENIIKIVVSLLCIIVLAPIIVCDLYYGYNDHSCVQKYPKKLNINMKIYLLVSAYTEIAILIMFILSIYFVSSDRIYNMKIHVVLPYIFTVLTCLFSIVWNIIGAVIFWGSIYNHGNCDKNVSTYLFVTLIIKLVGNLCYLNQANKMRQ